MSGHSKWNNIKRKKEKTYGQKAKIFTRMGREISVAIREGGSADPSTNSKLKDAIAKAKANNVPNDNIERILKKAASEGSGENYEALQYEGYGPCGIAVIVDALTDNKNRTVAEVRHYLDKYGKGMGASGCVSWQFDKKGVIVINGEDLDEETVMMQALEAGAADFQVDENIFEVYTDPDDFDTVKEALKAEGLEFLEAEIQMVPQTYTALTNEDDIKNMEKMLEVMEANDDIQDVWHNWEE
jgi:YebC/PmpR family DNA-binding regulatory protein